MACPAPASPLSSQALLGVEILSLIILGTDRVLVAQSKFVEKLISHPFHKGVEHTTNDSAVGGHASVA